MTDRQPQTKPTRRYESLPEAAARVGCNPRTLRRRIAEGALEAFRFGPRTIRLDADAVDLLMSPIPTVKAI